MPEPWPPPEPLSEPWPPAATPCIADVLAKGSAAAPCVSADATDCGEGRGGAASALAAGAGAEGFPGVTWVAAPPPPLAPGISTNSTLICGGDEGAEGMPAASIPPKRAVCAAMDSHRARLRTRKVLLVPGKRTRERARRKHPPSGRAPNPGRNPLVSFTMHSPPTAISLRCTGSQAR